MTDIRTLRSDESPLAKLFLQSVWNELFGSNPDPYVRDYFNDPETLKDLENITDTYFNRGGTFLVAINNEEIVATGAIIQVDSGTCELCRMFVRSDFRRQGIAETMSRALIDFAKANGYIKMCLGSNRELIPSHHLYKKLGFGEIEPASIEDGKYAIFMEKQL
jgi:GNAT superfamily N-acetyltransferase